ncbi:MAG TPA: peptidoglycan recognition family protein [Hyphomicrobiaceae bacterium]|nr:peptidoglycan recognition family protein [Hyphomicrobiaceae bacterium]
MPTSSTNAPSTSSLETFACEAAGDPQAAPSPAALDELPAKPDIDRTHWTTHKSSRNGKVVDHIVIHYTTSRNIEGTIAHFMAGTPRVSAHYIVGRDGELVQMVPDQECAWHAGTSAMNARSIGIEHVARAGDAIAEAQARTSIALISWLMHAFSIPRAHIIPHACVKATSCCGDLFKDFGGGAGLPCPKQMAALQGWLAAHGIGGSELQIASPLPQSQPPPAGTARPAPAALSTPPSAAGRRCRARTGGRSAPRHPRSLS